jgi:hypothetical protein
MAMIALLQIICFSSMAVQIVLPENPHAPETMTMCVLMETNTTGAVYDYTKLGAAFDLALEYARESILPPWMSVRKVYENLGNLCSTTNGIISHALSLIDAGINCNVYIGPGEFNKIR